MEARGRRAPVALAFALAGLASAWSPLAASFSLVTCLGAAVLAVRAWRGARPRLAVMALGLALIGAVVASSTIWRATSAARGPGLGAPAAGTGAGSTERQLDDAAAATKAERERSARELEQLPGPKSSN